MTVFHSLLRNAKWEATIPRIAGEAMQGLAFFRFRNFRPGPARNAPPAMGRLLEGTASLECSQD